MNFACIRASIRRSCATSWGVKSCIATSFNSGTKGRSFSFI
jgi:hypothetical protein